MSWLWYVDVNEDRRKEPPNPREPIELSDDDTRENRAVEHPASIANQSQQLAATPAAQRAQVHLLP